MPVKRILWGAFIIFVSVLAGGFGELDDAPGLVLAALLFGVFGAYLLLTNRKVTKLAKKRKQ